MSTVDNTGRQLLPVQSEYDFSGTTVNGPSFFISFDASGHNPPTNYTFSVNGQPVQGITGSFNWYETGLDVSTGALGFFDTSPGVTTFMGEVDNQIFAPNNGTDIGALFYQGHTYALDTLTVTDPPVSSVPAPQGLWMDLMWVAIALGALRFWEGFRRMRKLLKDSK